MTGEICQSEAKISDSRNEGHTFSLSGHKNFSGTANRRLKWPRMGPTPKTRILTRETSPPRWGREVSLAFPPQDFPGWQQETDLFAPASPLPSTAGTRPVPVRVCRLGRDLRAAGNYPEVGIPCPCRDLIFEKKIHRFFLPPGFSRSCPGRFTLSWQMFR